MTNDWLWFFVFAAAGGLAFWKWERVASCVREIRRGMREIDDRLHR